MIILNNNLEICEEDLEIWNIVGNFMNNDYIEGKGVIEAEGFLELKLGGLGLAVIVLMILIGKAIGFFSKRKGSGCVDSYH